MSPGGLRQKGQGHLVDVTKKLQAHEGTRRLRAKVHNAAQILYAEQDEVHLLQHHFQIHVAPGYCVVDGIDGVLMLHGFGKAGDKCERGTLCECAHRTIELVCKCRAQSKSR